MSTPCPNARRKRRARYVAARLNPLGTLSPSIREQIRAEPRPADTDAARRFHAMVYYPLGMPFPYWAAP